MSGVSVFAPPNHSTCQVLLRVVLKSILLIN